MTEVFRSRDSATVGHLQSLLEAEGIRTLYRNEFAAITTVAIPEVTPALCILDEKDLSRGVAVIRGYLESSNGSVEEELLCSNCGETNPGTFGVCWKCGESLMP
ncbi:putative signal transducing protein [Haloferula chungangensis]|uniref:Signal transducing protein n=1 Tax=Haloferula chungangensis TaxID=1048331 RepID=A0ABW2LE04_9BACT